MRVALVQPPRGPDAVVRLAAGLASRGHDVTLVAGRPTGPLMSRRAYEPGLADVPAIVWRLARGDYDVAHAFAPAHAWAAVEARLLGGPPCVVSLPVAPSRPWLVAHRYRLPLLLRAVAGAAAATVPDRDGVAPCRRYLLREPLVVPPEPEDFEGVYEAAAA